MKGWDLIAFCWFTGRQTVAVDWQMGAAFADKGVTATPGLVAFVEQCRSVGMCAWLCSHVTKAHHRALGVPALAARMWKEEWVW